MLAASERSHHFVEIHDKTRLDTLRILQIRAVTYSATRLCSATYPSLSGAEPSRRIRHGSASRADSNHEKLLITTASVAYTCNNSS